MPINESEHLYDNIGAVDYSMHSNTKGGARKKHARSSSKKQKNSKDTSKEPIIVGGCLTCPKGKKKIQAVLRILTVIIPKQYAKYKKASSKKKPANKKTTPKKYTRGGMFDSLFSSDVDCNRCNSSLKDVFTKKYSADILNTDNLNFYNQQPRTSYTIDTTLSPLTSRLGYY
jgi:hypothetical protein